MADFFYNTEFYRPVSRYWGSLKAWAMEFIELLKIKIGEKSTFSVRLRVKNTIYLKTLAICLLILKAIKEMPLYTDRK